MTQNKDRQADLVFTSTQGHARSFCMYIICKHTRSVRIDGYMLHIIFNFLSSLCNCIIVQTQNRYFSEGGGGTSYSATFIFQSYSLLMGFYFK